MRILKRAGQVLVALLALGLVTLLTPVGRVAAETLKISLVQVVNDSSTPVPVRVGGVTGVIPVRNLDEPARNPYQESRSGSCSAQGCAIEFSPVPDGKRLVVTNINGIVDVIGGTLPNCLLSSRFGGAPGVSPYANWLVVPFQPGTVGQTSTRMVANQQVRAYFGPGEGFYFSAG